jgi:hypothetical protein
VVKLKLLSLTATALLGVLIAAGCSPLGSSELSADAPSVKSGSLADLGIKAPLVLAMRDEAESDDSTGDATLDHLILTVALDEVEAACVVRSAGDLLPPNVFAALRFAAMYTADRYALAAAMESCADTAEIAARLITSDPTLSACISESADPASSAPFVAAVVADAVSDLGSRWPKWMPETGDCLLGDAAPADPSPFGAPDPVTLMGAFTSAPDGYDYVILEPGSSGAGPVSSLADGNLGVAFEVKRAESDTPEALVLVITWDVGDAGARVFADGWLGWMRADKSAEPDEIDGVEIERLTDAASGLNQVLFATDGLAAVIADTGGGEEVVAAVLTGAAQ